MKTALADHQELARRAGLPVYMHRDGALYLYDTVAATFIRVDASETGVIANAAAEEVVISGDGSWIAFSSRATNLAAAPPGNGARNLYLGKDFKI